MENNDSGSEGRTRGESTEQVDKPDADVWDDIGEFESAEAAVSAAVEAANNGITVNSVDNE
jgi:hypothetical protein